LFRRGSLIREGLQSNEKEIEKNTDISYNARQFNQNGRAGFRGFPIENITTANVSITGLFDPGRAQEKKL